MLNEHTNKHTHTRTHAHTHTHTHTRMLGKGLVVPSTTARLEPFESLDIAQGWGMAEAHRKDTSTVGEGASARSAEGGASASTIGEGTGVGIAGERASASTIG